MACAPHLEYAFGTPRPRDLLISSFGLFAAMNTIEMTKQTEQLLWKSKLWHVGTLFFVFLFSVKIFSAVCAEVCWFGHGAWKCDRSLRARKWLVVA